MTHSWQEVWNRREASEPLDLAQLIKLDGFDSGTGKIEPQDWQAYANTIGRTLDLQAGRSVFEIGCGSGAFLFALKQTWDIEIGGLDYSRGLIAAAQEIMPGGRFEVSSAQDVKTEPQYDYVIANSVFHYLDQELASDILDAMIGKARLAIAVLDVPDVATRAELESIRRGALGAEEYKEKYRELKHTYYSRQWFVSKAEANGRVCRISDGCVPNYAQSRFRFNAMIK